MLKKEDECGALWQKSAESGDYFSGHVEIAGAKHKIVVFANRYKDADKKPDWIIYKSKPLGQ